MKTEIKFKQVIILLTLGIVLLGVLLYFGQDKLAEMLLNEALERTR